MAGFSEIWYFGLFWTIFGSKMNKIEFSWNKIDSNGITIVNKLEYVSDVKTKMFISKWSIFGHFSLFWTIFGSKINKFRIVPYFQNSCAITIEIDFHCL